MRFIPQVFYVVQYIKAGNFWDSPHNNALTDWYCCVMDDEIGKMENLGSTFITFRTVFYAREFFKAFGHILLLFFYLMTVETLCIYVVSACLCVQACICRNVFTVIFVAWVDGLVTSACWSKDKVAVFWGSKVRVYHDP